MTSQQMTSSQNAASANAALTGPWQDLRNGDLTVTDKIIADDFTAHAAPITGTGPDELHGRDALNDWGSAASTPSCPT